MIIREKNGTFAKGGQPNPGGRKGYGYEKRFRHIFRDVFDDASIRATMIQLKSHVFGQKVDIETGKIVTDADSTPQSRIAAATKVLEYGLGKPKQFIELAETSELHEEVVGMITSMAESIVIENDEKLEEFVDEMKDHLAKLNKGVNEQSS
jgi:hypothetical protein